MCDSIKKVVSVGTVSGYGKIAPMLFLEITLNRGRLSISGVEGPQRNGDCIGSAGQCIDALDRVITFEPGFTPEIVKHLKETWERWHLNDMRPGCEHQTGAAWDASPEIEIVTYKLTGEALQEIASLKREAEKISADLVSMTLRNTRRAILRDLARSLKTIQRVIDLPYYLPAAPDADGLASGRYEVAKRETRRAGNVSHTEHPRGLLGKPCEVCGYRYGSAWRTETIPQEVIAFLESLPATRLDYPWRRSFSNERG